MFYPGFGQNFHVISSKLAKLPLQYGNLQDQGANLAQDTPITSSNWA